jgi:twitching motility protein PilT
VTYEEALKNVSNPDDFALRFSGIASTSDAQWSDFSSDDEEEKPETDAIDDALADDDGFSIDRF